MVNNPNENKPNGKLSKYIYDLIAAALENNPHKAELIAFSIARSMSREDPDMAKKIQELLSIYSIRGSSGMRGVDIPPIPVDMDTHFEMVSVVSPSNISDLPPILNNMVQERISNFLEERKSSALLMEKGIRPSNSLLLIGQPGTGKTMLAHHIASILDKKLIVLDLSASISSLLGKTGHNLKRVLTYAKNTASVLLLDEFDAIAKRRDDNTDLGEIKRVVNVLLMELENWPVSSILIATSNHPELLDKAIWRRFDHTIEIPIPSIEQRIEILKREMIEISTERDDLLGSNILELMAELLEGKSAADICKFSNNVKRRIIIKNENLATACLHELELFITDKKMRGKYILLTKKRLNLTVREIAKITGMSPAGVQHHLKK